MRRQIFTQETYNPIEGVKNDYEKLLESFTQTESVRYEQFSECWRQNKMSFIFAGRPDYYEAREFTEECLKLALTFALKPYGFQVRIGGLYLIYGIYMKQLCEPKIQIRITLSQWKELLEFMAEVETQEHFDVEYVFSSLRFNKAFIFVATSTQVEALAKEPKEDSKRGMKQRHESLLDQKGSVSELLNPDNIAQLAAIHEKYHQMKCAIAGNKKHPEKSMDMLNTDLVQYVTKSVATHEEWRKTIGTGKRVPRRRRESGATTTSESEADSDYEPSVKKKSSRKTNTSRASKMAEIKSKAFTNTAKAAKSRRYRQAVTESDKDKSSESPIKKRKTSQQDMSESDSVMSPPETASNPRESNKTGVLDMPIFAAEEVPTKEIVTKGKGKGRGKKSGKSSPNKKKKKSKT